MGKAEWSGAGMVSLGRGKTSSESEDRLRRTFLNSGCFLIIIRSHPDSTKIVLFLD
ncbi:MAG: hypothetical protein GWO07_02670 [Candidatus Dadabacteria bacterium]|nr:hypothetical protein [Candidatus Dadabacteria bacterium]